MSFIGTKKYLHVQITTLQNCFVFVFFFSTNCKWMRKREYFKVEQNKWWFLCCWCKWFLHCTLLFMHTYIILKLCISSFHVFLFGRGLLLSFFSFSLLVIKQRGINMIFVSLYFMSLNSALVLLKLLITSRVFGSDSQLQNESCVFLVPKISFWWSGSTRLA